MGLLDRIAYTAETVKKQKEEKELNRALALKELRDKTIPIMDKLIKKYEANVKYLDSEAYVFVIEDEKERGIYIPYTNNATLLDLKLDTFVHDYGSVAKHKMKNTIMKSMNSIADSDGGSKNFWDKDMSLKSFNTSLNKRK